MKVRFLSSFSGPGLNVQRGDTRDISKAEARDLIEAGHAEEVSGSSKGGGPSAADLDDANKRAAAAEAEVERLQGELAAASAAIAGAAIAGAELGVGVAETAAQAAAPETR